MGQGSAISMMGTFHNARSMLPMMPQPWTQTVRLRWRPELRFFEQRTTLMRQLEDDGILPAFIWQTDWVAIRIGEFEALEVGVTGLTARLMSPRPATTNLERAVEVALKLFKPRDVFLSDIWLQYFLPVQGEAQQAQARTAEALVHEFQGARATDWALLIDGFSDRMTCGFQVEYGVVGADEVPMRLQRVSRPLSNPLEGPDLPPDLREAPTTALFLDWHWGPEHFLRSEDEFEDFRAVWQLTLHETERLSAEVQKRHKLTDRTQTDEEAQG